MTVEDVSDVDTVILQVDCSRRTDSVTRQLPGLEVITVTTAGPEISVLQLLADSCSQAVVRRQTGPTTRLLRLLAPSGTGVEGAGAGSSVEKTADWTGVVTWSLQQDCPAFTTVGQALLHTILTHRNLVENIKSQTELVKVVRPTL